jgi:hypothetical protein
MYNTLSQNDILLLAEQYLINKKLRYVKPGTVGRCKENKVEVIFLKSEALDPDVVIDLPDKRVWVDTETKEVTWIFQL